MEIEIVKFVSFLGHLSTLSCAVGRIWSAGWGPGVPVQPGLGAAPALLLRQLVAGSRSLPLSSSQVQFLNRHRYST